jgi:hypothetical protein
MGKMIKGDKVDVNPCSLEEIKAYGGWDNLNLPEGLGKGPRPDTPTAGTKR